MFNVVDSEWNEHEEVGVSTMAFFKLVSSDISLCSFDCDVEMSVGEVESVGILQQHIVFLF